MTQGNNIDYRIAMLAVGTFAIGTDGFVIAGILPEMSQGLQVPLSQAGLLVTVFALVYALAAPVAGAFIGRFERRRVLMLSMLVFAAANLLAANAPSYGILMVARVLAALSAAAYSPVAVAQAVQLSPPERRGRASSAVYAGLTLSLITGVPLGSWLAHLASWRMTFLLVAAIALLAAITLRMLLPISNPVSGISLAARLAPLRRPIVLAALASCFIWMAGGISVYTYIVPLVRSATGWSAAAIPAVLLLYGLAAIAGNLISGRLSDSRFGPERSLSVILILHALALVALGIAVLAGPAVGRFLTPVAIVVFAASGWACTPPQTLRLIGLAPASTVEMLSLNTMASYLGIAGGAALGALVISQGGVLALGFVGAIAQALALFCVLAFRQSPLRNQERVA
jgi:multidrug resistance protein